MPRTAYIWWLYRYRGKRYFPAIAVSRAQARPLLGYQYIFVLCLIIRPAANISVCPVIMVRHKFRYVPLCQSSYWRYCYILRNRHVVCLKRALGPWAWASLRCNDALQPLVMCQFSRLDITGRMVVCCVLSFAALVRRCPNPSLSLNCLKQKLFLV